MDGVILTIRLSKKAGPAAERAREMLAALGIKVIGVVVNGLSRSRASGQFGSSYYSTYGYDGGYEYEPDENEETYYHEEQATPTAPPGQRSPADEPVNPVVPAIKPPAH
jgi:Mrp family chromosome partitioning ATPase